MYIRLLTPEDAWEYWELRLEALKQNPAAFSTNYEEAVRRENPIEGVAKNFMNEGNYTFGAFVDGKLIGNVTLLEEKHENLKHRANILAMYVTPERRGTGIGKALLSEAVRKARAIPELEKLNLNVETTNDKAKKLYLQAGFEVFGREEKALKLNGRYYDEEYMALFL